MRIAYRNLGEIDSYGRGEHRWNVNWVDFLKKEGHTVVKINTPSHAPKCDFFFDSTSNCAPLVDKGVKHIHLNFTGLSDDMKSWPCYNRGGVYVAIPYRFEHQRADRYWENDGKMHPLFLPMCYADHRLPSLAPSFERKAITWACKEPFASRFLNAEQHVLDNSLWCLRAVSKLSKKTDLIFNVILYSEIEGACSEYKQEVLSIMRSIPTVRKFGREAWPKVVNLMSDAKLSVHPGTIAGSILESVFTKAVPAQHVGGFLSPIESITKLKRATLTSEQDWSEVLDSFWFNERIYMDAYEFYQDRFIDHRSDGCRRAFTQAVQEMGISYGL